MSTPYGPPTGPITIGTVAGRRVAFVPRHGSEARVPAAPGELSGEPVGVPLARCPAGVGTVRRRFAAPRPRGRHPRGARPTRRPDLGPGPHPVRSGGRGGARVLRRPLLPARTARALPGGHRAHRRRHSRCGERAAVLQSGRIGLARRPGVVAGRDDRPARGGVGPRTGPLLHGTRRGHRPRCRRRRWLGGQSRRGTRDLRSQPDSGSNACCRTPLPCCRRSIPTRTPPAPAGAHWTVCRCRSSCRNGRRAPAITARSRHR